MSSTMRRRGSSLLLDEAGSVPSAPVVVDDAKPAAAVVGGSSSSAWRVALALGLMALAAYGGASAFRTASMSGSFRDLESHLKSSGRSLAQHVADELEPTKRFLLSSDYFECLNDVSKCPKYTLEGYGRLETDWPLRYTNKAKCYKERFAQVGGLSSNVTCHSTCLLLFEEYLTGVDWAPFVVQACLVGCSYYENFVTNGPNMELEGVDCMWNCKNTVMNLDINAKRCNWANGLSIAVFEPDLQFGAHHACEMGCILGGHRPCGLLERLTGVP